MKMGLFILKNKQKGKMIIHYLQCHLLALRELASLVLNIEMVDSRFCPVFSVSFPPRYDTVLSIRERDAPPILSISYFDYYFK